jgi:hypothetical protein
MREFPPAAPPPWWGRVGRATPSAMRASLTAATTFVIAGADPKAYAAPPSPNGMVRPCSCPASNRGWQRGANDKDHAMSQKLSGAIAAIGIDIGKNSFHVVGLDARGAILLRQKWSRGQVEGRLANMPPCLIGMEACVGAHHLSRKLKAFGHDARQMPAKYVAPIRRDRRTISATRRRSLRRSSARR